MIIALLAVFVNINKCNISLQISNITQFQKKKILYISKVRFKTGRFKMTTVDSAVNSTWKYLKMYPEFVLGTGYDAFSNRFKASWQVGKNNNLPFKKRFGRAFKAGTDAAVRHNDRLLAQNEGSFWKATKNSITSIWPDLQTNWTSAGEAAKVAGKSAGWAKFKSIGKVLGKRMPLIGAVMTLAFELPNIIRTTTNEGVLAGAGETAKTGVRLGISTLCGALTQAFIPIPFLGGMVGFAAGDLLGRFIVGKSYSEKKEAEKLAQANSQFSIDTSTIPYGGNNMSNDEEFMKLQQAYLQAAGQGNNMNYMNFNNPSNPFGSFNMMG